MKVQMITALNGVTATTASSKIWVGDYDRVAILCRRADHSSGSTAFTVKGGFGQVASDTPTMTAYSMLIDNVANTNAQQNYTHTASHSLAANGDVYFWLDPAAPVTHIEITATETTDGTHSAFIFGFYND